MAKYRLTRGVLKTASVKSSSETEKEPLLNKISRLEKEDVQAVSHDSEVQASLSAFRTSEIKEPIYKAPLEEDEPQGAFFPEEEETKVISTAKDDSEKSQEASTKEIFNPFADDDEDKKTSRAKLKAILGNSKKSKESSDELLEKVDKIYSAPSNVDELKETMDDGKEISLSEVFADKKKKNKKVFLEELDGENDEYEIEAHPLEEIYSSTVDDDDEDDYEEFSKKKKTKKPEFREYLSPDEKEEFRASYRKRSRSAMAAVVSTFVFTVLLFCLESPAFPHIKWLAPGKYGIFYLLLDLQLLLLSGVCIYDRIQKGVSALFKWKPSKNSVTFMLFAVSLIQIIFHLCFSLHKTDYMLFSSVTSACAFVNAIAHYLDVRRESTSFRMASTDKPKYIASALDSDSEEYAQFSEYLSDSPYMYAVKKTDFVTDFVRTSKAPSVFDEVYKVILPLVVFTSVLFAVISNIMTGVPSAGNVVDSFALAMAVSMPISSLFTVSLPFFKGCVKLSRRGCTVIGESSLDAASSASVISFKDTDAFHEKGIKVTSVKTYGETRIDTAILTAARVFNITGGPLKGVFNRSIIDPGSSGSSENDIVMQILPTSILSIIDGNKILIGNKTAVMSSGIECVEDGVDSMFEDAGGRIMFMVINNELAAKFYIKYALGKNFKAILDAFYDIGICMSIKSCDPNLDTEFLTKLLRDDNYPIVVIKLENTDTASLEKSSEKDCTGVVSNTSIPNMLRTFLWCDKCRRIIGLNNLAKYVSIVLSVVLLAACLFNANAHEYITPVKVLIYQLIWMIPTLGTSLIQ